MYIPDRPESGSDRPEPGSANRRILIIDDNPAIHDDFRKIFGGPLPGTEALTKAEIALFGGASRKPWAEHSVAE